ncbi:MAG: SurA N-terminal domain-containing protein, partial [Lentimicrobiaceae bacterium]|nr:SurA N-terminal domain-containing protein [Lentimicrobiaceae bacterium]
MALIGDIRKRSGLLVIIIGVALAAFVLGDLLSNRRPRQGTNQVGKINGEPILFTDFNQNVEENIEAPRMNSNVESLTADEQFQIRQSTWDNMVNDVLLAEQVDKLGLTVSTQELDDQIRGKKPHPYIEQSFTDPESGRFDPAMVINFLQNLDNVDPQMRQRYLMIEKAIKEERLSSKYRNLIAKGFYTPKAFAKRDYEARNTKAAIRYYALSYSSIADSLVTLSDKDLKAYYEKNKYRYQQEASRDLEYISFNIVASPRDREKIDREVRELYKEFQETTQVPSFVNFTSDEKYDSTWFKRGTLPFQLDSIMFNSSVGTTFGPYVENNMYQMARLIDVQSRPDSLRASHILIAYQGSMANPNSKLTKAQADAKADSLLQVVRNNAAKFDELAASDINDDKVAAKSQGDLNWFADGAMVPVFNNAVLNNRVGDIIKVESPFGFHIIKITGKTTPVNKVRVAIVKRGIEASSQTNQNIYTEASQFAVEAKEGDFEKLAEEKGYTKRLAERISKDQNSLPGMSQAREVVRWAFDEKRKVGDISPVFEVDGKYIVAKLTEKREKGTPTLEQVKEIIEPLAKREKKAEKIIAEINKEITS